MGNLQEPSASGRIIFVEKDISMREMMELALCDEFQIVTVHSAEKGLELVKAEGPFDIVISGLSLPGMNGLEFLRRVGELHPETVRILMTGGNVDMGDLNLAISKGHINRFVLKPFCICTLQDQLKNDLATLKAIESAN